MYTLLIQDIFNPEDILTTSSKSRIRCFLCKKKYDTIIKILSRKENKFFTICMDCKEKYDTEEGHSTRSRMIEIKKNYYEAHNDLGARYSFRLKYYLGYEMYVLSPKYYRGGKYLGTYRKEILISKDLEYIGLKEDSIPVGFNIIFLPRILKALNKKDIKIKLLGE